MNRISLKRAPFAALGLALVSSLAVTGVALAATDTTKSAGTVVDDAVITTRVKAALIGDPVTKARNIEVETARGVVQLSGFVDSSAEKSQATEVVRKVSGVRSVENKLDVRTAAKSVGGTVDDAMLTTKVKAALAGDANTKATEINVASQAGVVQLSGTVATAQAKAEAERVAGTVKGVQTVQNKIDVR
jgi:hyperosmotically inducible protein